MGREAGRDRRSHLLGQVVKLKRLDEVRREDAETCVCRNVGW